MPPVVWAGLSLDEDWRLTVDEDDDVAVEEEELDTAVSTVNALTDSAVDAFPAASVTVTVQLLWAPSLSEENVTVLLPDDADVVTELQSPP